MVVESLNFIINEAVDKGLITRVQVGKDQIPLTHLQYADDTLIFLPKDTTTVLNYRRLFDWIGG